MQLDDSVIAADQLSIEYMDMQEMRVDPQIRIMARYPDDTDRNISVSGSAICGPDILFRCFSLVGMSSFRLDSCLLLWGNYQKMARRDSVSDNCHPIWSLYEPFITCQKRTG